LNAGGTAIAGKTFVWASGNTAVATVNNGLVSAVMTGSATITATVDGKTGTALVNVSPPQ
jgi:uncharacterized protein YjdB